MFGDTNFIYFLFYNGKYKYKKLENKFLLISFCLLSSLLNGTFWPYLWENPLIYLIPKNNYKFRWIGEVFLMENIYS